MHQHKTVAQVILILFIVNFVLAAPAVREIDEARDDVMARVLAADVGAVAEKRFRIFGTPMIPWEDSDWDSGDEGYETAEDEPPQPFIDTEARAFAEETEDNDPS